ncbi:alanine racemase [Desulfotomaculum arcticum]|uniref:Alanine racemase n=1 Tax=Desulfotruncus arcticus DSM 17038 TaxID=1121424 RepID=A0A1I2XAX2_9FIRM|nr:alanine racemase [Desulfotruncus arcticus]SFH09141.1 alanine racemase [Desulfotomaculum arcticum] [Desulfotruncus arcticus DSM 17038]
MYGRPVWAEVDLSAIAHNIQEIRSLLEPGTRLMAIVKADGYGHGALPVAVTALQNGAQRLGVAIAEEGIALRSAGVTVPILILGYTPAEMAEPVVQYGLTPTVYSLDTARALSRAAQKMGKTASVHLKIETGMGRLGITPGEASELAASIAALPGLAIEGLFSHLASADSADKAYASLQRTRFNEAVQSMESSGLRIPIRHLANSAAILDLPDYQLDMVRAGIIIYGLWPSEEVNKVIDLRPAMQLKARVSHVKQLPRGYSISYGCTYTTDRDSTIATVPLGYADGWSRLLSPKARVLVNGCFAPVVGRICMDQFMIDVSDIPGVEVGSEVVLFGRQGDQVLPVEKVAEAMGTINYEVVCMISKRVPRCYV